MPRKRRRPLVVRREVQWDDLGMGEWVDLMIGWSPGQTGSRWATWADYLVDWQRVRVEAMAEWKETHAELLERARSAMARRRADWDTARRRGADRELARGLLRDAEEVLAEEEGEALPFAERVYQALLRGDAPPEW
jgi:hypothetical protein